MSFHLTPKKALLPVEPWDENAMGTYHFNKDFRVLFVKILLLNNYLNKTFNTPKFDSSLKLPFFLKIAY